MYKMHVYPILFPNLSLKKSYFGQKTQGKFFFFFHFYLSEAYVTSLRIHIKIIVQNPSIKV